MTGGKPQRIDDKGAFDKSLKSAKSIHPPGGFVPDEVTATRIGEAVATSQYGEKTISHDTPFRPRLRVDVWTVQGTLHPQGVFGGTAVMGFVDLIAHASKPSNCYVFPDLRKRVPRTAQTTKSGALA